MSSRTMMDDILDALDRAADVVAKERATETTMNADEMRFEAMDYRIEALTSLLQDAWGEMDWTGQRGLLATNVITDVLRRDPKAQAQAEKRANAAARAAAGERHR